MRIFLFGTLTLLLCMDLVGCSSSTTSTASQQVNEIAWLPDESGALAFIDKISVSSIDGSSSEAANLYRIGADGSVGSSINPNDQILTSGYPTLIFVSPDGHTAITQFENDIFRIDLSGGGITDIIQNEALLGVSGDLHYAATTNVAVTDATKLLTLFRLTGGSNQIALNGGRAYTIVGVNSQRALWLDSGRFAFTIYDSTGSDQSQFNHVGIYDTTGSEILTIPNADVSLHASAYAPGSRDLFVRNHANGIDRINLTTGARSAIVTKDTVYSMDVSSDGTLLVYSSDAASNNGQFPAIAVNVSNGHTAVITTGVIVPIISPHGDRVACIHQIDGSNSDIHVVAVALPP